MRSPGEWSATTQRTPFRTACSGRSRDSRSSTITWRDPRGSRASWSTAATIAADAAQRRPTEVELDDVEDFSLYRKIALEDPFPYSDSLHLDFLGEFSVEDVREVLLRLPDLYRTPLVLVHMYGYATKEVAQILDAPLGTVLARLHRGRKLFEKQMWNYAEETGMLEERAP